MLLRKKSDFLLKLATLLIAFISLISASELIYLYNNKPESIGLAFLWISQKVADNNQQLSFNLLLKGAEINIRKKKN